MGPKSMIYREQKWWLSETVQKNQRVTDFMGIFLHTGHFYINLRGDDRLGVSSIGKSFELVVSVVSAHPKNMSMYVHVSNRCNYPAIDWLIIIESLNCFHN